MRVVPVTISIAAAIGLIASCGGNLNPNYRSAASCDPTDYAALLGTAYVPGQTEAYPSNRTVVVPGGRLWPADGRDDFYRFYLNTDFSTIIRIDCAKNPAHIQLPDIEIPANGGRNGPIYVFGEGFQT